jgi:hypothetical protein
LNWHPEASCLRSILADWLILKSIHSNLLPVTSPQGAIICCTEQCSWGTLGRGIALSCDCEWTIASRPISHIHVRSVFSTPIRKGGLPLFPAETLVWQSKAGGCYNRLRCRCLNLGKHMDISTPNILACDLFISGLSGLSLIFLSGQSSRWTSRSSRWKVWRHPAHDSIPQTFLDRQKKLIIFFFFFKLGLNFAGRRLILKALAVIGHLSASGKGSIFDYY